MLDSTAGPSQWLLFIKMSSLLLYIQSILLPNVHFVWSRHFRLAVKRKKGKKGSRLFYSHLSIKKISFMHLSGLRDHILIGKKLFLN